METVQVKATFIEKDCWIEIIKWVDKFYSFDELQERDMLKNWIKLLAQGNETYLKYLKEYNFDIQLKLVTKQFEGIKKRDGLYIDYSTPTSGTLHRHVNEIQSLISYEII